MSLQLTIACGDYDRTHPLIDGSIKPEGLELNWLVLPHLEIWTRMLNYYDFDASEISLSSYLIARTIGKPLTAIPVSQREPFATPMSSSIRKRHPRAERSYGQASRLGGVSTDRDGLGAGTLAARIRRQAGRHRMVHLDATLAHGDGTAKALQSDPYPAGSKA